MTKKELSEMTLKDLGLLAKEKGLKEKENSMLKNDYVDYIYNEIEKLEIKNDDNKPLEQQDDELLFIEKKIKDNWHKLTELQKKQLISIIVTTNSKKYINKNNFTVNISSSDVGKNGYAVQPYETVSITNETYINNKKIIDKRLTLVEE